LEDKTITLKEKRPAASWRRYNVPALASTTTPIGYPNEMLAASTSAA